VVGITFIASQAEFTPGNAVSYTLASGGVEREVKVTLGTLPREVAAKWLGAHIMEHHVEVAAVN